jgi:Domain of unknown function (DUF4331)
VKLSKALPAAALMGGAALALVVATSPLGAGAADHLDAPGLQPPSGRFDADITDIYAFQGSDASRTALVLDTHPAAGAFSPLDYGQGVDYLLNIDRNGDAVADLAYDVRFGAGNGSGHGQPYTITRYTGANARSLAHGVQLGSGTTGSSSTLRGDGRAFAGLRSDPFFFDLPAFLGAVTGAENGRTFCDAGTSDFFAPLNVNSIVIELPDDAIDGDSSHIGYWATTRAGGHQVDRMGRPAINTVFNKGTDKNAFNAGSPSTDRERFGADVVHVLETLGGYSEAQADGLADVLLPDVLTYDTSTVAQGPLNGRALTDDVIDAELGIVTHGAITSDCVGAHHDTTSTFPYLGAPHGA